MNPVSKAIIAATAQRTVDRLPPRHRNDIARQDFVPGADRVEISTGAARIANLENIRGNRDERIERTRREIAAGTYETERKIDATVERLFADLSAFDIHA